MTDFTLVHLTPGIILELHPLIKSERWTGRSPTAGLPWINLWWRLDVTRLKLRMLRMMWDAPCIWYREVWQQDSNNSICCTGYMCGCYGADYYSYWRHLTR